MFGVLFKSTNVPTRDTRQTKLSWTLRIYSIAPNRGGLWDLSRSQLNPEIGRGGWASSSLHSWSDSVGKTGNDRYKEQSLGPTFTWVWKIQLYEMDLIGQY